MNQPKVSLCVLHDGHDWVLPWAVNQRNSDTLPEYGLTLNVQETKWRDIYHFLLERGLELRPRYNPGWVPSWLGTDREGLDSEYGIAANVNQIASEPVWLAQPCSSISFLWSWTPRT